MIDIHNHLLFNIDDGSTSLEESVKIIEKMNKKGYTDIILTPHYIADSKYSNPRSDNLRRLEELKSKLKENNIPVNLYLGNEIYIDDKMYDLLKREIISSLNNTNLILVELPMSGDYSGYQDMFSYLRARRYRVVLAHPERYLSFQKDFNKVYEMVKMGVYLQCNIDSINGKYGEEAKKMLIRMLKEDLVSFLATDIHHEKHNYDDWDLAKEKMLKYIPIELYNELTIDNPKLIIEK